MPRLAAGLQSRGIGEGKRAPALPDGRGRLAFTRRVAAGSLCESSSSWMGNVSREAAAWSSFPQPRVEASPQGQASALCHHRLWSPDARTGLLAPSSLSAAQGLLRKGQGEEGKVTPKSPSGGASLGHGGPGRLEIRKAQTQRQGCRIHNQM